MSRDIKIQIKVADGGSSFETESSGVHIEQISSNTSNEVKVKISTVNSEETHSSDLPLITVIYPKEVAVGNLIFTLGEVVLAKMRGYCPWPAFVKEIYGYANSEMSVIVEFFGDHTELVYLQIICCTMSEETLSYFRYKIAPNHLKKYEDHRPIIMQNLAKKGYLRAVKEADLAIEFSKSKSN